MVDGRHWVQWHAGYDDPRSSLSRRLSVVKRRLRDAVDHAPGGSLRLISMCAGQGRDVIGVLSDHHRAADVDARLIERNPALVDQARSMADRLGLPNLQIVTGDASTTSAYAGAVPADIVLACGVFGNISAPDINRMIRELPHLMALGGTVIWTRHRRDPDLTPWVRAEFTEAGFEEIAFDTEADSSFGVGTNRLVGAPGPYRSGRTMFTFSGDGHDAHS